MIAKKIKPYYEKCQVEERVNKKGRRDMNVLIDRVNRNYFINSRFIEINQMLDIIGEPRYDWSEFHKLDFERIEDITEEVRKKYNVHINQK